MATKTISIMDDVYDILTSLKAKDESFSDEIRRLVKNKGNILDFAGAWSDISEADAEKMKKRIIARRSARSRLDELQR